MQEYFVFELFDLMGSFQDYMTLREVYLIICYTAANQSKQNLQFFYQFGNQVFEILSGGQQIIYAGKLKMLGSLLGVPEKRLDPAF